MKFISVPVLASCLALLSSPAVAQAEKAARTAQAGAVQSQPAPDAATPAGPTRLIRPRARPGDRRCTLDGSHCIARTTYLEDVCRIISAASEKARIDPHFMARLLWQESLFDAAAISPAGAHGIAQFMPATAKRRGLKDPFNPAMAIFASARYLADMSKWYGNPGLAAAGYNAGESRVSDFIEDGRRLPPETRNYVQVITGLPGETWRDSPPEAHDFTLAPDLDFHAACLKLGAGRSIRRFRKPEPPWGVIIAAGRRQPTVEGFASRVRSEHPGLLSKSRIAYVNAVVPGFGTKPRVTAQVATDSRAAALRLCEQLRRRGAFCLVNRN